MLSFISGSKLTIGQVLARLRQASQHKSSDLYAALNTTASTYLKIEKHNPENIKFDYLGRIRLFVMGDKEIDVSNYENLIAKFENETKEESLKNFRIEFFKYSHNPVVNFPNWIWWNYSYQKGLILFWTLASLCIFIISTAQRGKMQELYLVMVKEENASSKWVRVLAFTTFIFFSLKIDFDTLPFKKPGLVIYFFFQYLVGLGCLFFILNFILSTH